MSSQVVIIDYGMGNTNSLKNKLARLEINSTISSDENVIRKSNKIILPGIGHFGKAMERLHKLNLINVLNEEVLVNRKPILGICLGMQLMGYKSEEGNVKGLSWIDGETVRFNLRDTLRYKVPHVCWNEIDIVKKSALMENIDDLSEFYFDHAFHFIGNNDSDILNITEYEYRFVSAIEKENIFGVQYHPEKSYEYGDKLLKNFHRL